MHSNISTADRFGLDLGQYFLEKFRAALEKTHKIFRGDRRSRAEGNRTPGFTQIQNETIFDPSIRGWPLVVLTHVLALPPDFNVTVDYLTRKLGRSDRSIRNDLLILRQRGYCRYISEKDPVGRYFEHHYFFSEVPQPEWVELEATRQKLPSGEAVNPSRQKLPSGCDGVTSSNPILEPISSSRKLFPRINNTNSGQNNKIDPASDEILDNMGDGQQITEFQYRDGQICIVDGDLCDRSIQQHNQYLQRYEQQVAQNQQSEVADNLVSEVIGQSDPQPLHPGQFQVPPPFENDSQNQNEPLKTSERSEGTLDGHYPPELLQFVMSQVSSYTTPDKLERYAKGCLRKNGVEYWEGRRQESVERSQQAQIKEAKQREEVLAERRNNPLSYSGRFDSMSMCGDIELLLSELQDIYDNGNREALLDMLNCSPQWKIIVEGNRVILAPVASKPAPMANCISNLKKMLEERKKKLMEMFPEGTPPGFDYVSFYGT